MSATLLHPLATALPAVVDEPCDYAPLPPGDRLLGTGEPGFQDRPIPVQERTRRFQVLAPAPLTLVGFRAFLTAGGRFLTDESLDPSWNRDRYAARFAGGASPENLRADFHAQGVAVTLPADEVTVEEPVSALCAAEPANYGSWLFRILPKLASLPDDGRALLVYAQEPWQREMLAFFAPGRRVVPHDPRRAYRLRDAQIATARNAGAYFDERTKAFYGTVVERIPGHSSLRRIYLSRRGQRIRPILNEDVVEEVLAAEGFAIVRPEAMPIEDCIRVIRDAEVIACPGGSGLFNLAFARSARLVVDVEPARTWLYAHNNVMKSLGLPHAILFGEQPGGEGVHAPWTVPIDRLRQAVRL